MRSITVLVFACICALTSGYYLTKDVEYADSDFLVKQKAVFEVLQNIHQHSVFTKLELESKGFQLGTYKEHFTKPEYVTEFLTYYKHGLIKPSDIFSILNDQHREQAIALYNVFYYAKDWDTFYKTFVWARLNVNAGLFNYAFSVAILHRPDTVGIVLPAAYEVYPYFFFDTAVIQQAQQYKMQGFSTLEPKDTLYSVVIPTNYTEYHPLTNPEERLTYFTEDIGWNSYYYYLHLDYPFWMGGEDAKLYKDRRGEFYFYQYQQILARYYLERISNGLGSIPYLSYKKPIKAGYYPHLRYYNGEYFPSRENDYVPYNQHNYYDVWSVEEFENRIWTAVQNGFIVLPNGTHVDLTTPESVEYLGNFFDQNPDSQYTRFSKVYDVVARKFLGTSFDPLEPYHVPPSVLEHYETALRDPVFYQYYKRELYSYFLYKDLLPHYTYNEINFEGVKIEKVELDKLITYFDYFDADITNAVNVERYETKEHKSPIQKFGRVAHYHGDDYVIKARQYRLNHMPFTFKIQVDSNKVQKAIVKVFIGPQFNEFGHVISINENRRNFFELDHFLVDFVEGKNVIVRNSQQFSWFVNDRTTYYELYTQLMLAVSDVKGGSKFPLDMTEAHCGYPSRLMLPKGKKNGMPFKFFFFIAPYHAPEVERFTGYDHTISCGVGSGARYLDTLPFGYPFDRIIDEKNWKTPNMFEYDVNIFHKLEKELNTANV